MESFLVDVRLAFQALRLALLRLAIAFAPPQA